MKSTARIITLSLAAAAIIGHFTLLTIHALWPNKYSFYYNNPFFSQNWNLFVPAPSENLDLFCFYKIENKAVKRNLTREILNDHKENLFSGKEFLLTGLLGSIHYYKNQTTKINEKVLLHFTEQSLEYLDNSEISNLRFVLIVSPVNGGLPRIYHNFTE